MFLKFIIKMQVIVFLFFFASMAWATKPVTIKVMTFNIENGGTQVDFNQVVKAIRTSSADIVGLQETWGNTEKLAKSLQWKYYNNAQHIISKYPLKEPVNSENQYLFVEVTPSHYVAVANMHLPDEPYGPTLVNNQVKVAAILNNERQVRLPVALPYIKAVSALAKHGMPVFLTGDFNSPSHLDWTDKTLHKARNHNVVVPWVVTKTAADYGLKDSFRVIHPDTNITPGYTWPAARPFIKNSIDGFNPSPEDFSDRLDFIFYSGNARVIQSDVMGMYHSSNAITPWPSDHAAVVSEFEVTPVKLAAKTFKQITNNRQTSSPSIATSKSRYHAGETIKFNWKNAPGNRYDYIHIIPMNASVTNVDNSSRLYTHAKSAGSMEFNADNIHGNWPEWNKNEVQIWPLLSGVYRVELMLDDSATMIASTTINVI